MEVQALKKTYKVLYSSWRAEAVQCVLKWLVKMKSTARLNLTGVSAMATLVFNKPECDREMEKHMMFFLLISYQQYSGRKPGLLYTLLGCSEHHTCNSYSPYPWLKQVAFIRKRFFFF
jgi:hypothetical protein